MLPAIVSDIDGVLYAGPEVRGNSNNIIDKIVETKYDGKSLPFVLLTNGGMQSEKDKIDHLNHKLGT
jgi:ribonucleotide monophosphatase NagD (HAD superfamily)